MIVKVILMNLYTNKLRIHQSRQLYVACLRVDKPSALFVFSQDGDEKHRSSPSIAINTLNTNTIRRLPENGILVCAQGKYIYFLILTLSATTVQINEYTIIVQDVYLKIKLFS